MHLRTDYVSATDPKMCHFVTIRGIRGRSGIVTNYKNWQSKPEKAYFQPCEQLINSNIASTIASKSAECSLSFSFGPLRSAERFHKILYVKTHVF